MTKRLMDLQRVTPGAWAVLAVLIASCAAIVIWAPSHFYDSLAKADWRHVGGVITLIGGAFIGLRVQWKREVEGGPGLSLAKPWERPGFDDEAPTDPAGPRAIDRRDRPPGDRQRGSISPMLAFAIVVAGSIVLAVFGGLLSGCGASAIRINATANTVATVVLEQAHRAVLAETDEAIAACPPAGSPDRAACLAAGEERIRPLGMAYDGFRLAVVAHREGVETAVIAGDSDIVRVTLARSWAIATREYDALLELLLAGGADVSFLMPLPEVE